MTNIINAMFDVAQLPSLFLNRVLTLVLPGQQKTRALKMVRMPPKRLLGLTTSSSITDTKMM